MMPTMMFSSQPCSRLVPAIMLATQPANAPKMIQEMIPKLLSIACPPHAASPNRDVGPSVQGQEAVSSPLLGRPIDRG